MSTDQVYDSNTDFSQCIGDMAAPADFNPDAKPFEQAPPGVHMMEVADFKVALGKEFSCKVEGVRQTFYLTQLRPQLRIVGGQHDGATVNDFLPVPTINCEMPTLYANQWANFVKALGFELPQGRLMPAGFQLQQIKGKRCMVKIVISTDRDGKPKLNQQGEPFTEPAFFGYSRVGAPGAQSGGSGGVSASKPPAATGAAPTPRAPVAPTATSGPPDIGDL